jgi:pyruvate ferredoxin oxidoreductase beta subunit
MAILGLPEEEYFSYGHRACAGCGAATALRLITKAAGKNSILVEPTGCMEVVSTPYPETAWKLPWVHGAFENPASIASGVLAALKSMGREDVNVVAFGGDGSTYDIGFGHLSGAFERGHNFTYICYDNEAYMNTGIQRSGSTPYGAATTTSPSGKLSIGKSVWKKDLVHALQDGEPRQRKQWR